MEVLHEKFGIRAAPDIISGSCKGKLHSKGKAERYHDLLKNVSERHIRKIPIFRPENEPKSIVAIYGTHNVKMSAH